MNVLNTLFVLSRGAYLAKDHQNVLVKVDGEARLRVPIHTLSSIACFGALGVSPHLMALCLDSGVTLTFFAESGRFRGKLEGAATGSLVLRKAHYAVTQDIDRALELARSIVLAKIANSRQVLLRRARESKNAERRSRLGRAADHVGRLGPSLQKANTLDQVRGYEGEAAATYFSVFNECITADAFSLSCRNRNPPRDPVNAMLSFAYALLLGDCIASLTGVGLDPYAGFLHGDRPGRPSLALDLMEELRAPVADRLVLAVLNRSQIRPSDFVGDPTGGVSLKEEARRSFIVTYQSRKQETIEHPFLGRTVPWALVPHLQARLLARTVRGDLEGYPPFTIR